MKDQLEEYKYKQTLDLNKRPPALQGLIKVNCPSCNNSVSSANININDKLAKCDDCDGIFSFSNHHDIIQHDPKPEVLQPEGVEIFHFQNELDISFNQPLAKTGDIISGIFLGIFTPLTLMFTSIGLTEEPGVLFVAAFFFIICSLLAMRLILAKKNKTYITIDDKYLSIVKRPYRLPFAKDEYYLIDEFDQIYIKKRPNPNGGGKSIFEIHAVLNTPKGQKHIKLSPILESKSKAQYIEQEMERHLGITDRPVPEED